MMISIITVTFNSEDTIEDTMLSVFSQNYKNIEYIIIDGGSTDNTMVNVRKYNKNINQIISENDQGIYDAINKGIKLSTGDIVHILNSDDVYANQNILTEVVDLFKQTSCEILLSKVKFFKQNNQINHKQNYTREVGIKFFSPNLLRFGYMPAHPGTFIKKNIYDKFGMYKINYQIASDYELFVRFLMKFKIPYLKYDKLTVKMREGGKSTKNIYSNYIITKEIMRAFKENNLYTNYLFLLLRLPIKILKKIYFQFTS
jgi:glycosyltransferase involved in cell wall biosynthesis